MRHKPCQKPIASLSLDLDNQWSYMKIHDVPGWESFPSYLDLAVPRILDFLKQYDLKITFFILGQDAALQKNQTALRAIADAGHEIGNHSFHPDSQFHFYSVEEIEQDVVLAGNIIQLVTGVRPTGFRGSGLSNSSALLQVLQRQGYDYDASTFPTGPMEPMETPSLVKIPATALPIFKIPIHFSYVLYLSSLSSVLGLVYFRFALLLCRLTQTQPSLLLNPLDFLSSEDVPQLAFMPGMTLPTQRKLAILSKAMRVLSNQFMLLTLAEHAQQVEGRLQLPLLELQPQPNPAKVLA